MKKQTNKPSYKVKLFKRFLKDNNLYAAYMRNFSDPHKRSLSWRYSTFDDLEKIKVLDFRRVLCVTLYWYETNEGYDFWYKKHIEFFNFFSKYYYKYRYGIIKKARAKRDKMPA